MGGAGRASRLAPPLVPDNGMAGPHDDLSPPALIAAMAALAGEPAGRQVAVLMPWVADPRWLAPWIDALLAPLAADPFARPGVRFVGGVDSGGVVLAEAGDARLSLLLRGFTAAEAPAATLFVPGRSVTRVLVPGGAMLHRHHVAVTATEEAGAFTAAGAALCASDPPTPLEQGALWHLDTARDSYSLASGGDVLLLELAVQPPSALPVRAYDIAGGHLVHVAASRRDSSFRAMALSLLRAMRRTDAAPLFAQEMRSDDFAARWHAARELAALDPLAAQGSLAAMAAADPHPEIRAAAAATLAMLRPEEAVPCRI